jgi:hypothetical protein
MLDTLDDEKDVVVDGKVVTMLNSFVSILFARVQMWKGIRSTLCLFIDIKEFKMLLHRVFNLNFYLIGMPTVHTTTEYATKLVFNPRYECCSGFEKEVIIMDLLFLAN